jgi:hypothetical protein
LLLGITWNFMPWKTRYAYASLISLLIISHAPHLNTPYPRNIHGGVY